MGPSQKPRRPVFSLRSSNASGLYRRALLGLNMRRVFHSVTVEEIKDQKLACEREMAVDPRDQEFDLLQIWNLKYEEVR